MIEHSPTPFITDGNYIGWTNPKDAPCIHIPIARIENGIGNRSLDQHDEREANAEFIVKACNMYDELVNTLQDATASLAMYEINEMGPEAWLEWVKNSPASIISRARALIQRAEGEK